MRKILWQSKCVTINCNQPWSTKWGLDNPRLAWSSPDLERPMKQYIMTHNYTCTCANNTMFNHYWLYRSPHNIYTFETWTHYFSWKPDIWTSLQLWGSWHLSKARINKTRPSSKHHYMVSTLQLTSLSVSSCWVLRGAAGRRDMKPQ